MKKLALALSVISISGHAIAAPAVPKQLQRLLAMTPADFESSALVQDDSLDVSATISTQPGFQYKQGLLGIVWQDNFLRIFVDKKTGEARFQVYEAVAYQGGWRFYEQVNYETPDGPKAKLVTVIARDVNGCSGGYFPSCTYTETFGFDVDEALLRKIASLYVPNARTYWQFKFKAKSAPDYGDGLVAAEVAGALARLDHYREDHKLSATATPAPDQRMPEPALPSTRRSAD